MFARMSTLSSAEVTDKQHIPVLDGVRGIAVLFVLLFHFMPDPAMQWKVSEWSKKVFTTGGWIGVDLFFVLSGFLITGILLRAKSSTNYFSTFYIRRALRIFPLYYGALLTIFFVLPLFGILTGPAIEPHQKIQVYYWLYLGNVSRWLIDENTLRSIDAPVSFGHLWSLAVEEHFYIIWPAIVLIFSPSALRKICITLFVSALCFRCVAVLSVADSGTHPFLLTPLRWDALAAGAFVATWYHEGGISGLQRLGRWPDYALTAGSGALILLFYSLKGLWPDHWAIRSVGLSIVAGTGCAFLITLLLRQNGVVGRIASSGVLRFFGKYSYGLYLIHGFLRPTLDRLVPADYWLHHFSVVPLTGIFAVAGIKIAICTVFAVCSWHFYEYPILKLNRRFSYRRSERLAPVPDDFAPSGSGHPH